MTEGITDAVKDITDAINRSLENFLGEPLNDDTISRLKNYVENFAEQIAESMYIKAKPSFKVTKDLDLNSITLHAMNTFSLYVLNATSLEYCPLRDIAIEKQTGKILKCAAGVVFHKDTLKDKWVPEW